MKKLVVSGVMSLIVVVASLGVAQAQKESSTNKKNEGGSRNIYEVRAGIRRGDAHTHERRVAGRYQGRLSLQG